MKLYNKHIYPNPFRHRKLKISKANYEMLKKYNFKSLLPYNLSEFEKYFDEFGNLKPECRIKRLIRNTITDIFDLTLEKTKSNFLTKRFIIYMKELELKSFENYQKNLSYLEIPLQPLVDKEGFKIQLLSNNILVKARKSIKRRRTRIYDYPPTLFPDTIKLWEDFARSSLDKFPIMSYDYLLECAYARYDAIFYKIDSELIKLSKWNIVTDLNGQIAKIVEPNFRLNYLIYTLNMLLKFVRNLVLLLLTIQCTIYIFKIVIKMIKVVKRNVFNPTLIPEIRKKINLIIENFLGNLLESKVVYVIKAVVVVYIEESRILRRIKLSIENFSFKREVRNFMIRIDLLKYKLNFKYQLLRLIILIINRIIL